MLPGFGRISDNGAWTAWFGHLTPARSNILTGTLIRHGDPGHPPTDTSHGAGYGPAYPFGAVNPRVLGIAQGAGYELGFGGVRGGGSPLELPRVPVYFWDAGDGPFGLRTDAFGSLGRIVAHIANRCAVGTSVMKRLGGLAVERFAVSNRQTA